MYRELLRYAVAFWLVALALYAPKGAAGEIYRCTANGQTILTDHNTGHCEAISASRVNVADSTAVATSSKATNKTSRPSTAKHEQAGSIVTAQLTAKQRCQRIDSQLAEIQSKMRAGYSLKQGERLRERQRSMQEKRSIERCR